ncbi:MAG TPA: PD-(D/E)XK nuclease family protein, partial [Anaerolineae bacterium]|nr:PD-(D/E)XK nuclease family protein [Anaerolineae bacterium]
MMIERHFLDWNTAIVPAVLQHLVPDTGKPVATVDLEHVLVLVPTRHAGRRLREALALLCASQGSRLLAPSFQTPADLVSAAQEEFIASRLETAAIWTIVLRAIDVADYAGLFPAGVPVRDFSWALSTGSMLQTLRDELAEHGMTIESILSQHQDLLQELQRWRDLAKLERLFITVAQNQFGLHDPCLSMLHRATAASIDPAIERVVLACNPDPTPIALAALEGLSHTLPIEVLIHAPASLADGFDNWGRPRPDRWRNETIDIGANDLSLASSPVAQGRLAIERIIKSGLCPPDVAVGVPDDSVAPHIESGLSERGVASFDPSGEPLRRHQLFQLLDTHRELMTVRSYNTLSAFLRNADVLEHLHSVHGVSATALLGELDRFQNVHLPATIDTVAECLRSSDCNEVDFTALRAAMRVVESWLTSAATTGMEQSLRALLQSIYSTRELRSEEADDQVFRVVAEQMDDALRHWSRAAGPLLQLSPQQSLELLLHHLAQMRYPLERPADAIELEGWLELPWEDATFLVVTGVNDAIVPQRLGNEAFLPDSLRNLLGLRNEAQRLARDTYLAKTLVESRRHSGAVCFICGKYGQDGEPLRPSRILFRCRDTDLPGRAARLFGPPDDVRPGVPATISFLLQPWVPAQKDRSVAVRRTLPVTAFRDYLRCPFRFYLKRVLRMETLHDQKAEMDALDFGELLHHALASMAADADMRQCTNELRLRHHLMAAVDRWATRRFGQHPPLHVTMQLDIARERLSAAARAQAQEAANGWQIVSWEQTARVACGEVTVTGRIDRVDYHQLSGAFRVLDYKSSERVMTPEESHLATMRDETREYTKTSIAGKARRWIDLQLPLYVWMLQSDLARDHPVQAGYFNLPRDP